MRKPSREEIDLLHHECCSALNDRTRMAILYELADGPCHVGRIVDALGLPQGTISRHLKVLREHGMLSRRREGNRAVYSLQDPRILDALNMMRTILADNLRKREETAGRIRMEQESAHRKRGARRR